MSEIRTGTHTRTEAIKRVIIQFAKIPSMLSIQSNVDLGVLDRLLQKALIDSRAFRSMDFYFYKDGIAAHVFFRMNWQKYNAYIERDGERVPLFDPADAAESVSSSLKELYNLVVSIIRVKSCARMDWWITLREDTPDIKRVTEELWREFNLTPPSPQQKAQMTEYETSIADQAAETTRNVVAPKITGVSAGFSFLANT